MFDQLKGDYMCRAYMLAVGVLASFVSGLVGWWAWISRQEMAFEKASVV